MTRRAKNPDADWDRIEADYRAGILSNREIAAKHDVAESNVRARAKKGRWTRDLSARVAQKVRSALLLGETRSSPATENEAVEEAAATQIDVIRSHRRYIAGAIQTFETLSEQLVTAIGKREQLQEAIEALTADDKNGQRYNTLMRAVSIPVHIGAMKDLTLVARTLFNLERQAFGLAESDDPTPKEVTADADPAADALAAARERHRKRLGLPDPGNKADSA